MQESNYIFIKYIYKKVETENIVNRDAIKQEIEDDKLKKRWMMLMVKKKTTYHEIITNKVEKMI